MDGYALRAADVPAAGTRAAGGAAHPGRQVGAPLQPGTAARIFTGAQIPAGADAVVMQEQCEAPSSATDSACASTPCRRRASGSAAAAKTCAPAPSCCSAARASRRRRWAWRRRSAPASCGVRRAARGAVLHRRRAGDARRAAEAGRDLQLQPLHAARAAAGRRLRVRSTSASCPTGSTPRATRCAAPPRRHDLIAHLRRRVGGRRRPPASRRCRPRAGSTCGRSRSSPASRSRSAPCGAAMAASRCSSACRATRCRASVTFLLAVRPVLRVLQGARAAAGRKPSRCARTSTGRKPERAARVPARARRTPTAGSSCSQPELGRADLGGVGRRPDRQPAGQAIARGDTVRFLPLGACCCNEDSTALLRVAARGPRRARSGRRRARHDARRVARPADRARRRACALPGARARGARGARSGDGRRHARRCTTVPRSHSFRR